MTPEQKIEIEKFFNALGILAGTAGAVYRDKKVDMTDLAHVMALFGQLGDIMDGFDDLDVVFAGMGSMEVDDIISIIKEAVDLGKTYEDSRKA